MASDEYFNSITYKQIRTDYYNMSNQMSNHIKGVSNKSQWMKPKSRINEDIYFKSLNSESAGETFDNNNPAENP